MSTSSTRVQGKSTKQSLKFTESDYGVAVDIENYTWIYTQDRHISTI